MPTEQTFFYVPTGTGSGTRTGHSIQCSTLDLNISVSGTQTGYTSGVVTLHFILDFSPNLSLPSISEVISATAPATLNFPETSSGRFRNIATCDFRLRHQTQTTATTSYDTSLTQRLRFNFFPYLPLTYSGSGGTITSLLRPNIFIIAAATLTGYSMFCVSRAYCTR